MQNVGRVLVTIRVAVAPDVLVLVRGVMAVPVADTAVRVAPGALDATDATAVVARATETVRTVVRLTVPQRVLVPA